MEIDLKLRGIKNDMQMKFVGYFNSTYMGYMGIISVR